MLSERVPAAEAKRLSSSVLAKKTSWEKEGGRLGVSGSYLRRHCESVLWNAFDRRPVSWLSEMTVAEATVANRDVLAKKSSWRALGELYGVSDVAVRKRVKALLWDGFEAPYSAGFDVVRNCAYCKTAYSRKNYDMKNPDAHEGFCSVAHMVQWQKENLWKGPTTERGWHDFYRKHSHLSMRSMAETLGMNREVLTRHLHAYGILEASPWVVRADGLKPFVKRFVP